jgi:hypothetical protein
MGVTLLGIAVQIAFQIMARIAFGTMYDTTPRMMSYTTPRVIPQAGE